MWTLIVTRPARYNNGGRGKEDPGGDKGVEKQSVARHLEVCGATRVMTDQGGAEGTKEPGGA